MRRLRWRPCQSCGCPVYKVPRSDRKFYCVDCAIAAIVKSCYQLRRQAGKISPEETAGAAATDSKPQR